MDKVIREGAVRVGVDLAKRVIQVHAVDAAGRVVTSRALARDKFIEWCVVLPAGCIVAMEASSSAHHWAGPQTHRTGVGRADHLGTTGEPLPQRGRDRQERRQRRGRHLRGRVQADDALASRSSRSSSKACCACTGCAKASRKTAPPASTDSAGCWPSSAIGGDDGTPTTGQDLPVGGGAARALGLAEGGGGIGQQERTHPVGRNDARRGVRCQPPERQTDRLLITAPTPRRSRNQASLQDVKPKMC